MKTKVIEKGSKHYKALSAVHSLCGKKQKEILDFIGEHYTATITDIANELGGKYANYRRYVSELYNLGVLGKTERVSPTESDSYYINSDRLAEMLLAIEVLSGGFSGSYSFSKIDGVKEPITEERIFGDNW